ncbi:MAG: protein adenylyltransferase SelO family protein, partial [Nitrospirales bacterium]
LFPELKGALDRYARFFHEAALCTARLLAQWQAVGFAHGVMNSDNMSVLGLTLDYGPFGFLDDYDPAFICNHSDRHGRYSFRNQPDIGYFNLRCLAQALTPLVPDEAIKSGLDAYEAEFAARYGVLMRAKLGLTESRPDDEALINDLLELMRQSGADYTNVFRALCDFTSSPNARNEAIRVRFLDREAFDGWAARYKERLRAEGGRPEGMQEAERAARMKRVNPKYILRNYLAHTAIRKATEENDDSEIERLRRLLADPFAEHHEMARYATPPPDWGKHLIVSCSS